MDLLDTGSTSAGAAPAEHLRNDVALSWRRAELSGLRPTASPDRLEVQDFDPSSRLLRAAGPVLDDMARHLEDTCFCVLLADRECRIVARRFGERGVDRALDRISAVPGCRYVEENTGTNSVATPFELRRGMAVRGDEHYLQDLKRFTCYGHPIFHPATNRLEGVLDITGLAAEENPLLAPFVLHAVADIEQRLLDGASRAEQRLLAAFQRAQNRPIAILALGEDVVLANNAAMDLVETSDHALLREIAQTRGGSAHRTLRLGSGTTVEATVEPVAGSAGTLFALSPVHEYRQRIPRRRLPSRILPGHVERELRAGAGRRDRVLITGEPGTGRSTAARELGSHEPVATLDSADVTVLGEASWCARFEELAAEHAGLLVIEDAHLLPALLAARVSRVVDTTSTWLALTTSQEYPEAEHAALFSRLPHRVELPPLRTRREELPALARTMLSGMAPGRSLRLTPSTLELLAGQSWPGNFRELESVLRQCIERRSVGDITPRDLPEPYQFGGTHRRTQWEQAEHELITKALRAAGGNKVHAARDLGISRSTLYNRLKALGIQA